MMGVPAHDSRDYEFAVKYGIFIRQVIKPLTGEEEITGAYTDYGILINSGEFSGLHSREAIEKINDYLEKKGIGRKKVNYRLRDWLISRQRYWGAPIPMIHCPNCGIVPVPEKDLPVLLPKDIKDFLPKGKPPLANVPEFVNTTCPKCGGSALRDTDTMDTFMCSSWYFLRYTDPHNDKEPFSKEKVKYWMPIDLYVGGIEHATGHLLYFRFMTKFLYDEGFLPCDEPAIRLFNQGMVKDAQGQVMSKSKGNAVPIGPLLEKYGADTVRLYEMFMGPFDQEVAWQERGIAGARRFLERVAKKTK